MLGMGTEALEVGDMITYQGYSMTVWMISPPGSGATSMADGPHIHAHIRPGGFGIVFDRGSYTYKDVTF